MHHTLLHLGNSPSFSSQEGAQLQEALPSASPSALPSTSTAVIARIANQLQVKKKKSSASVTGIGDSSFVTDGHSVNITIQSRTSKYSAYITAVIAQRRHGQLEHTQKYTVS